MGLYQYGKSMGIAGQADTGAEKALLNKKKETAEQTAEQCHLTPEEGLQPKGKENLLKRAHDLITALFEPLSEEERADLVKMA